MILHILGLGCILVAFGQVNGHPACGIGFGEDVCAYKKVMKRLPMVVRPVELPRPVIEPVSQAPVAPPVTIPAVPVPPLLPIGGPCACKQTIVKPAIVPRPVCQTCSATCVNTVKTSKNCDTYTHNKVVVGGCDNEAVLEGSTGGVYVDGYSGNTMYTGNSQSSYSDHSMTGNNYGSSNVIGVNTYGNANPTNVPADAVSLSIAYNMAKKACAQNEDRLFFGFRQIPKEIQRKEVKKMIGHRFPDEGNLYSLNGEIVELKQTSPCSTPKSLAEEAAEELMDLIAEEQDEAADYTAPVRQLSLGEIGYGPAKMKTPAFIDIPAEVSQAVQDAVETAEYAANGASCQDGFQSGSVSVAQVPNMQPMLSRPKLEQVLEPCDDSLEEAFMPVQPMAVQYTSCSSNSKSSSSSSSSSSLFQKMMSKLS